MEFATVLVGAVIFLILFLWLRSASRNLPPCPLRPLPVVGHLFYMAKDARPQFEEFRKRCGDIYSLYMGGTLVVVLNGYDLIKEALVKKADVFSDRPHFYSDMAVGMKNKGIIFSNGAIWKEQRSVSLSILRAFGMGKNLLAEKTQEEVACYVDYLASLKGNPTDIQVITNISTCNIICSILIGRRFEYDDKALQKLMHQLGALVTDQKNMGLINFIFWLRYIPGDLFKAKSIARNRRAVFSELMKFIEEKKRHVVDSDDVCNLIDAYILERNKKIQAGTCTSLDDQHLTKIMYDLFVAGTETTSTTIYWCILYMLHYPEIQEKVYQEIKQKVGTNRAPTIQDKPQMTYLNAVICETQRLASIVPLSVTHVCSEDVSLRGYDLPKGAYIITNLDTALHDQASWGDDSTSFKPERFIDNNGDLQIPEQFIPFSTGRRVCLGEALAKMELFLFLSTMFQRFQFLPPTAQSVPELKYKPGIVASPQAYEVRLVERK
ncbi:unnamed protein product [Candidula unifasciata]|uniref:Steroid 21-hydroxylase n=1 Tax=Candidula unifasciata TaxID=100452 RepID=A0A8S3YIH2_9EUPU|nr:unnamed protein product [Candidula unifasciata]